MTLFAEPSLWDENHQHIRTRIGQWLAGEDVILRGRSLLHEWAKELDYMQLHVLNITGRVIDAQLSHWMDRSLFFTSYPDARIWCNQLGAMAATQKTSPVSAFVLGCLAADSKAYGSKAEHICALELQKMQQQRDAGMSVERIVEAYPKSQGHPMISGFSRPIRVADERLQPARDLSERLGFKPGSYLQLAEQVSDDLLGRYGLGMNAAAYSTAFLLDRGFSPEEIYRIRTAAVASGVMACYCDHLDQPENSFLPLYCHDIVYDGVGKRSLKR